MRIHENEEIFTNTRIIELVTRTVILKDILLLRNTMLRKTIFSVALRDDGNLVK